MKTARFRWMVLAGLSFGLLAGCVRQKERASSVSARFSALALQGKRVFEEKHCAECHTTGTARADSVAPDLSNPFLANDSMFVQTHLKFVERTKMPPLKLSDKEIRLLSYYVAELHRAQNETVSEAEADARCPVCYAPVKKEKALADDLFVSYLGTHYYFECEQCLETFRQAPEAFIELFRQYESDMGGDGAAMR
ncbi:MAG: YHS domain-containing protein [Calditrichaeota bacterium]|nr:MAG: YHS domain-containing protein [Calditrichota bacterium]